MDTTTEAIQEPVAPEEAPAPESVQGAPKAPDLDETAKMFAELSKKQRVLKQRERQLAEFEQKTSRYKELDELKTKDPVKFLESHGLTLDDVVAAATREGAEPKGKSELEMDQLKAAIEEQRSELAKMRQERERLDREKNYTSLISQIKTDLADKEEFEALNVWGNYDAVAAVMQKHYQDSGEVLSPEAAAKMVQDYIIENSAPFFKSKMMRSKYKQYFESDVKPEKVDSSPKPSVKTLTNGIAGRAGGLSSNKPLSREEALQRAARLIEWT